MPLSTQRKTTSLAVKTLSDKKFSCTLCAGETDSDHSIFRCGKYDSPDAKLSRLKSIRGCFKCANTQHMARQ